MKYLFFDIECSNCFNEVGKMCEFGYVLCNEKLEIVNSDDIPMSPGRGRGNRFHLRGRKGERDLELAYDYEFYLSQNEFPHFYERIKNLMEDPNTICFAYSMDNDIAHLYNTCKRYSLEPMNYTCYDVQKLVAAYLEKKGQMSLHNAYLEIVGKNTLAELQEHLSRDDAKMEKLIFEGICQLSKTEPSKLLKSSNFAKTNSIEFMNKRFERKEKKKETKKAYDLYRSLVCDEAKLDLPENVGRRYRVSGELKKRFDKLQTVISIIKARDGLFSNSISKTDYLIVLDEKNVQDIKASIKTPFEGKMITYEEFIKEN